MRWNQRPTRVESASMLGERRETTYSVEKLGFPQRALFRLPRIESDNCSQVFAEAILEDSRRAIAV
ncbi:MAG: hypothetical protein WBM03_04475, partial [Steroidobacteraceae bacterium]